MSFLFRFLVGLAGASYGMWQFERRRQRSEKVQSEFQTENDEDAIMDEGRKPENNGISLAVDELDIIRGIGPVYAQRLNRAGIQTIAQLAELAPEQIAEIVSQGKGGNLAHAQEWIDQAQQFAKSSNAVM